MGARGLFTGTIMVLLMACGSIGDASDAVESVESVAGEGTATFFANQGFVAETGEVVSDGSGIKVDVVAYKHGSWLDLKGGRQKTTYQPLNDMNRAKYQDLGEVPCAAPTEDQISAIFQTVEPGHGFTVEGNISEGVIKVFVAAVEAGGAITLDYEFCP